MEDRPGAEPGPERAARPEAVPGFVRGDRSSPCSPSAASDASSSSALKRTSVCDRRCTAHSSAAMTRRSSAMRTRPRISRPGALRRRSTSLRTRISTGGTTRRRGGRPARSRRRNSTSQPPDRCVGVGAPLARLGRSIAAVGTALAIAVALGCWSAGGAAAQRALSPCGTATAPTWAPDGTHIAWYGFRWPRPPHHHAVGSYNTLRAICISNADGEHLHRLRNTVCSERCSNALSDPPGQLDWVGPNLLLAGNDFGVFQISIGRKPKLLGHNGPEPYSTDAAGDRVATAKLAFGCSACSGPVTIRSVPSGAVVGTVGGTKLNNDQPSLSPDGTQVVFTRTSGKNGEAKPSIWTAAADGGHVQRLERNGVNPLWWPAGNRIAYIAPGTTRSAWRLVAPQGGASTTLLRNGPGT